MKFSNPDIRSFKKKRGRRTDSPIRKNRCKSSTLSLHTVAASPEEEEEPPLQRRNSIHNVPFVDVNDPETRTRMERYKEERRSMLRAKYKELLEEGGGSGGFKLNQKVQKSYCIRIRTRGGIYCQI